MKITISGKAKNVEREIANLSEKIGNQLIKRTYRVKKSDDADVKKAAKKRKTSESQVIRTLIENLTPHQISKEVY